MLSSLLPAVSRCKGQANHRCHLTPGDATGWARTRSKRKTGPAPGGCKTRGFEPDQLRDPRLEEAFGDSDDWPGHKIKIKIKCIRTHFDGKTVDGLRIYPIVPKPTPAGEANDEAEINL
jgi:hypothetical protein